MTLGPENLTAFDQRLTTNRSNPYPEAGTSENLGSLPVFDDSNCSSGLNATIPTWEALGPVGQAQFGNNLRYPVLSPAFEPYDPENVKNQYNDVILFDLFDNLQTDSVPAPACIQQPPFSPIGDTSRPATQYQHVYRQP